MKLRTKFYLFSPLCECLFLFFVKIWMDRFFTNGWISNQCVVKSYKNLICTSYCFSFYILSFILS